MLYNGDVEAVEKAVELGFRDQDSSNAWRRIKKFVEVAQKTPTNTGSPKLLNSLRRVLPLVKNGMSSSEIHDVRGVIADAIAQLRAGA